MTQSLTSYKIDFCTIIRLKNANNNLYFNNLQLKRLFFVNTDNSPYLASLKY